MRARARRLPHFRIALSAALAAALFTVVHADRAAALSLSGAATGTVAGWQINRAPTAEQAGPVAASCVSTSECVAVGGGVTYGVFAERWDGTQWLEQSMKPRNTRFRDQSLLDVSCLPSRECFAAGSTFGGPMIVERWDGQVWRRQPITIPNGDWQTRLTGVSCVSANFCIAVGAAAENGSPGNGTLIERWDGKSWKRQRDSLGYGQNFRRTSSGIKVAPIYWLQDVSCISERSCVAVGSDTGHGVIERWNGTQWKVQNAPRPRAFGLEAVSCVASGDCFAVGTRVDNRGFVMSWDGKRWKARNLPRPSVPKRFTVGLTGISCVSATACVAVGRAQRGSQQRPLMFTWNGKRWSTDQTPGSRNRGLSGVSCLPERYCVVT